MLQKMTSSDVIRGFMNNNRMQKNDILDYETILDQNEFINLDFDKISRLQIINLAVQRTKASAYLEIGCDYDETFANIDVNQKIGVDPKRGGNVRLTSDEFFATNSLKFDVIFIDGNHTYEQIRNDIENSLSCLKEQGIIIVHDMLPVTEKQVLPFHPPVWYAGWLGSAYRIAFELSEVDNFEFKIVKTDCGCGIIMNYDHSAVNIPSLNVDWKFYKDNYQKLPLISYGEYREILKED